VYSFEKLVSRLVDSKTGKDLALDGTSQDFSPSGQLSPRRDVLAMASASGGVELLNADLRCSERSFEPSDPPPAKASDWRSSAAAYSPDGKLREWSTADGQFKVEAQFFGKTGDTIRIKRKDNGKVIPIQLEKLSSADQAYVKGLR
jgi:hypothetical protein